VAEKGNKKKKGQKNKNQKVKSNHVKQKKDEAWRKVPPKEGEKQEKEHGGHTYFWCVHHMAWTMHSPKDCRLRKEQKGENKVANSATVVAAAATAVNPSDQALLSTLAKFQDKE
jgi:hypothetical protein